jgi:hypothetical protein
MSEHQSVDKDQQEYEPSEDELNFGFPDPPNMRRRIFIIISTLLALVIIGVVVSSLRTLLFRPSTGIAPTPTLIAGDNLFFIQSTPPGVISLDGHVLVNVPQYPNLDSPLHFARGVHHITYLATPFKQLTCTVYVPPLTQSQPCPYETAVSLDNS